MPAGCGALRRYYETFLLVHNKSGRAASSSSHVSSVGAAAAGGLGRPLLCVDYSEFLMFLFIQKYRVWERARRRAQPSADVKTAPASSAASGSKPKATEPNKSGLATPTRPKP